ncbi:MAG: AEC family transporter [Ilumatobacteraceae bacterium]
MLPLVIGAFLLGWLVKTIRPVPVVVTAWADKYVLQVALPAVIIAKISKVTFDADVVLPIAVAWSVMFVAIVSVLIASRTLKWDRSITGALLLVGVLGNTSFLGLGMVESLLGTDHLASAIAYDQVGTFVGLALWGSFVASTYGAGESGWRPVLKRLSRFGPFLALLASLVFRAVHLPDDVYSVLNVFGKTVAPVAMCALGLRFTLNVSRSVQMPAMFGLISKMVVLPTIVYIVAVLIGSPQDLAWSTSILQAAAPPMVTAGVVAVGAGLSAELVAFMVGVGTLVSFVSLPLLSLVL